jgi:hypothetical protein
MPPSTQEGDRVKRAVFRFVDYVVRRDDTAHATREAVCVVGEDADCGASSGQQTEERPVVEWMARHRADTGHGRFRRTFTDYATAEPKG